METSWKTKLSALAEKVGVRTGTTSPLPLPPLPEKWDPMNIDERNRFIAQKLNEGMSLSDLQKMLAKDHGINLKYLELRMLAAELQVNWDRQDPKIEPAKKTAVPDLLAKDGKKASRTEVSVSKLVRPGAVMSGDVTFASGASAEWTLDNYGRLGLKPAPGSEKPTEEDLVEFQTELQRKLGGQV